MNKGFHPLFFNIMKRIDNRKSKSLYSITENGCRITIQCRCHLKTDNIEIRSFFGKRGNGGIRNNPDCASYLGITVAEQVLSKVFKNVERMVSNNPGFDFICSNGYKIDVKSSTLHNHENTWAFTTNKNKIPDYFIFLAFDNRKDLNPKHVWLIPGNIVNNLKTASVAKSKVQKWDEYKIDKLDEIISCCNTLKHK